MARRRGVGAGLAMLAALATSAAAFERDASALAPRIVNGVLTAAHPTTVALLSPDDPGSAQLVCSGTLVGCRTVVTAAHCVEGALDPSDWVVFLQHAGFAPVATVTAHPDYAFPVADVAVVTLASPLAGVRPTPLDVATAHPSGTAGAIVGFGRAGGASDDYGLKRAGAVQLTPCAGAATDATSICWSFEHPIGAAGEDSNTCNGDSGGPLFVDAGGTAVLAGVTSGGSAADCLAPDVSFDARVAVYASWIDAVAGDDLEAEACGASPQVGDADVIVMPFAGTVSAAIPEGRHQLVVPAGASVLHVTMNGVDDGSDFDLYVRYGAPATTAEFDCRQHGIGQFAHCMFANPAAGVWHVLVDRWAGAGAYQVTATAVGAAPFCADPGNDGLPCDDGDACTAGETCQGGACAGGALVACDDGVACTADACVPGAGCVHTPDHGACGPCAACDAAAGCVIGPRGGCAGATLPLAGKLKVKRAATPSGDLLLWKLAKGEATAPADFGDPFAGDGVSLCLYDESGAVPALVLRADAPGGGTCGTRPCWQPLGATGVRYKDSERTPDGLLKLQMKAGDAGRTKLSVKGKGEHLPPLPALPLALPSRVQVHAAGGACWEAVYDEEGAVRNDATLFVGKSE